MCHRPGPVHSGFLFSAAACLLLLAACNSSKITPISDATYPDQQYQPNQAIPGNNNILSDLFGSNKDTQQGAGTGIGVNAYLWRGALDTLSFMPLASADPFGGVIITDWYQPPAGSGERFKATAYILGRQLRADAVKVSIYRQVQQGGQWMDAPVNPATMSSIEDKVLERARELRTQSAGG